ADLLTDMAGKYSIKAIDADTTELSYELEVALSMPVPAMMRQKAEKATIDQALSELKAFLED
ncbi:MAG: polyketide cyclase / dehydrase and lipid transport, partial [Actinobacteria bacterium]|nr:polyketide cyclase / dehydrase and lipid transport [Actinomycetota bacterium]